MIQEARKPMVGVPPDKAKIRVGIIKTIDLDHPNPPKKKEAEEAGAAN